MPTELDAQARYNQTKASLIFSKFLPTLENTEEIDSGWIDMAGVDKVQFSGHASVSGMTMTIDSREHPDQTALSTSVTYDDGPFYMFNIICRQRYMRFKWTNNTGSQVTNVSMLIKQFYGSSDKLSVFPIGVEPSVFSQAALTQAILRGRDPLGAYQNVATNQAGALEVDDFLFSIARGEASGFEFNTKFGFNSDIDTGSDPEDIIGLSSGLYAGQPLPSVTPETVTIVSSSGNDTSAGTGARTVRLIGLDANWDRQEVDVTLNGTTDVVTTETWRRLNRMYVLTAGSGGENAGTITVNYTTTTSVVFGTIQPGENQTLIACFTVPRNKTCYIKKIRFSLVRANGSAGSVNVSFLTRDNANDGVYRIRRKEAISTSSPLIIDIKGALIVPGQGDIICRVNSVSDNNSQVSATFEYILVDD